MKHPILNKLLCKSITKAVSTESVAQAKRKGLVPQSGDWNKPKRWVRPEDSDVLVDDEKKPRKKASLDLVKDPAQAKEGLERLSKIFGKDVKDSDLQDIWSSGVDDFSTRITDLMPSSPLGFIGAERDGGDGGVRIVVKITHEPTLAESKKPQKKRKDGGKTMYFPTAGVMDRTFNKDINGNVNVYHESFTIEPYHQGKGIAADISENVEEEYEKLGVHSINFNANADIGGYAWARQGYDFATPSDRAKIKQHFRTALKKNKSMFSDEEFKDLNESIKPLKHAWEFATLRVERGIVGKHLLMGTDWNAVKILDKKSPGYQIGKAYFAAKRNEKNIS